MKKILFILTAWLLAPGLGALPDLAYGTINGQVRQRDGRTWEELEVQLYLEKGKAPIKTALTDGDGRYHFDNLLDGSYEIHLNLASSEDALASFEQPQAIKALLKKGELLMTGSPDFVLAYTPEFIKSKYKAEFSSFAAEDKKGLPPPGGLVFAGSSTIRLWTTVKKDFAPLPVIHRGFGGSTMEELLPLAQDLVIKYKPKVLVVYEGDNDLRADTASVEEFLEFTEAFIKKVRTALPQVKIYFLGIKPSIARWARWPQMQKANQGLKDLAQKYGNAHFVNTAPPLLGPDGQPIPIFYELDNLHLNGKGYETWTKILKPMLFKDFGK